MQFCPKCGGIMMPVGRRDGKIVLKCTRCGYEMVVDAGEAKRHYTIRTRVPEEERVVTTSRVSEGGRRRARDLEEWEQEREEYREILLEQLQEELEGME